MKNNLPAKRQIDIFTNSANVCAETVELIKTRIVLLNKYKPNKAMLDAGFDVGNICYYKYNVNIDTIVYLSELYSFELSYDAWGKSIQVIGTYRAEYGKIILKSDSIEINILPNNVKQKIFINDQK
ncbi:MAG TPA: hypothetical protein DCQ31_03145 [Bacteroidales bacterium]|nr:hypothetical protein [Bacteroidales bacterium]